MADNCLSHILTEWHCIDPKIAWIGNENFLLGFFLSLEIYLSPVAEDWAKWQRVGKMPLHPMLSFLTNPAPIGCCPRKVKFHSVTDWRPKMWMNLPNRIENSHLCVLSFSFVFKNLWNDDFSFYLYLACGVRPMMPDVVTR